MTRLLVVLVALAGLLLSTAGACDTGAAPSAPPATVAPVPGTSDDSEDDSEDDSGHDSDDDADDGTAGDDAGDVDDSGESEGPDDGGRSGRGNTGESR